MAARSALPRVVELVRVSTQLQVEKDTPEAQRRALDALRKRRPGVLVERIEAPGVSGGLALEQRRDLQRLAELSKAKAYDELRVFALDRLTRADDPRERFAVYGWAMDAGAIIVDARGHVVDPSSEMGEIDYYLQTLFAAREKRKFRERSRAGMLKSLADGTHCRGAPPYARRFDKTTKTWIVVEAEAKVYREIIDRVLSGQTVNSICADLTSRGIPPPRSGRWAASTVKRLIHFETVVGRYRVAGALTKIPAICTEEEWRGARLALRRNQTSTGPKSSIPALLRGLARCEGCGRRMHVRIEHDIRRPYYTCPRYPVGGYLGNPCTDRARVRVDAADEAVIAELRRLCASKDAMEQTIRSAGKSSGVAALASAVEQAKARLAAIDAREQKTLHLLDVLPELTARRRLKDLADERLVASDALQAATEALRAAEGPKLDPAKFAAGIRALAGQGRWREALEAIVPNREPYGVMIGRDRSVTIVGMLGDGGNSAKSRTRSDRSTAACAILRIASSLG